MKTSPLTAADLDRLEELLDSGAFGEQRLLLDEMQAVLCAVAAAPEPVSPDVWIPAVLGESPAWESPAQEAEVLDLVFRLHGDIAGALAAGQDVAPLLYPVEEDSEELDFAAWADAYLMGTELGETDWFDAAGEHEEDLYDLLQPLFLLSGTLEAQTREQGGRWLSPAEEARAMAQAREQLPELPQRLHSFWRILAQPVQTLRRDAPKVGRNDPCPCGSGRKYKHCCGAPV
ncbi:MAG: UPF0149 family protein [Rhodocyclaceae bacterium]|nr:UPF0149 family protein [Rhodocyclaceae bacterium]